MWVNCITIIKVNALINITFARLDQKLSFIVILTTSVGEYNFKRIEI